MGEWKKVRIGKIFHLEKGCLQSSKCIQGKYDFITAAKDWKTHNTYTHDCEAIVYAVAASRSLGQAHYINGKFIASDLCLILTEKDKTKYPINFLFYQIIFESLRDEVVSKTKTGTSKEAISQKNFSAYEIPYFSIDFQNANYQRLINAKKIIAEINKEIEAQKLYVKQLRRNILQDAIEGKLTADRRKEHPVQKGNPDYDAEALFELIQKERQVDKKRKALPPILDAEKPFELPTGWKWVRLGEVISIETHIVNSSDYLDSIQIAPDDIEKGTGELLENLRTVREKGVISVNHLFSKDALLYSKIRPRLRKIVYVAFEGLCSADMYPLNTRMNKHFIKYLMLSDYFDVEVYKFDNRVKMPKINQFQLSSIKIPIVPLAEQNKIAEKIETVFTKCKQPEHEVSQCKRYINQTMQGVLKNAFGNNAK